MQVNRVQGFAERYWLARTIAVAMIASATACGPTSIWDDLPVPVDTVTAADSQVIQTYNSFFRTPIFIEADGGIPIRFEALPHGVLGRTLVQYNHSGIQNAEILISPDLFNHASYPYTLAHEFGHALGMLYHTSSGLMQESAPDSGPLENLFDADFVEWVRANYEVP